MRTITVCTDAGHKNMYKQSVAAWATYIRTPSQTIHQSGIMKVPTKGSSHAELYAIANALAIIGRRYDLSKYKLIVYSDNLYALRNDIDGSLGKAKVEHKEVYEKYIKPHINKALEYEARHVKGHLPANKWGPSPARFYMQNWCDEEVHRIMKIAGKMALENHQKGLVLLAKKEHNESQT